MRLVCATYGISAGIGIIAAAIPADPIRHRRRYHVQQFCPPDHQLGSQRIRAQHHQQVCVFTGITAGTHTHAMEEVTIVETRRLRRLRRLGMVRRRPHRVVRQFPTRQRAQPKLQLQPQCRLTCAGTGIIAGITTLATIPL